MPYFDEPTAVMPMLQSMLRYLALPAEQQIAEINEGQCVPCEVRRKFSVWREWHENAVLEAGLSDIQRRTLERFSELAKAVNEGCECYETERVSTGERFRNLRETARQTLEIFEWMPGLPEFDTRMQGVRQRRLELQKAACLPGPANLVYHPELCALLGIKPAISEQNLRILERRESELGFSLPASVKELLSIYGMYAAFYDAAGGSSLAGWDDRDEWNSLEKVGDAADIQQGYLHVATCGEGIVFWYIRLDEGADPPVYYIAEYWGATLAETPWCIAAESFSAFVKLCVVQG